MTKTVVHVTTVPETLNFLSGHIRHQQRHGWNVVVVSSPEDGRLADFAHQAGCSHIAVPMARNISPWRDLRALIKLISVLRHLRPSIVHAYTPKAGLLAPIAARIIRTPGIIVSLFGLRQMTMSGLRRRVLDATTRLSTLAADVVWCDSPSMRDVVVNSRLAPEDKVVVLGGGSVSGVDYVDLFNPHLYDGAEFRASLGIAAADFVIGFVGRLNIDKGMRELAAAWMRLRESYPEAHLILVGPKDGDLPTQILAQLTGGERTHWLGRREDVPLCLAAMDVFVMPSYREGFCVANIEASAMALPVVSTLVPGCVDSVTQGETGTLVPARNASALADAVARYLEDAALKRRHGEQGRRRVESSFAPQRFWIELVGLYDRLLGRNADDQYPVVR